MSHSRTMLLREVKVDVAALPLQVLRVDRGRMSTLGAVTQCASDSSSYTRML